MHKQPQYKIIESKPVNMMAHPIQNNQTQYHLHHHTKQQKYQYNPIHVKAKPTSSPQLMSQLTIHEHFYISLLPPTPSSNQQLTCNNKHLATNSNATAYTPKIHKVTQTLSSTTYTSLTYKSRPTVSCKEMNTKVVFKSTTIANPYQRSPQAKHIQHFNKPNITQTTIHSIKKVNHPNTANILKHETCTPTIYKQPSQRKQMHFIVILTQL
eukprot:gene13058-8904_t